MKDPNKGMEFTAAFQETVLFGAIWLVKMASPYKSKHIAPLPVPNF